MVVYVFVIGFVLIVRQVNANSPCSITGGEKIGTHNWPLSLTPYGLGTGIDLTQTLKGLFGYDDEKKSAPTVIRPHEIPKPAVPPASLAPVAGPHLCKKAIVTPAVLPKPVCHLPPKAEVGCGLGDSIKFGGATNTYGGSATNDVNCQYVLTSHGAIVPVVGDIKETSYHPSVTFDNKLPCSTNLADHIPADPVSISLALKAAQETHCPPSEDKLAFGFRKTPLEIPKPQICKNNIPEEQMYCLKGQVVELKPTKVNCCQKTLEQETQESLLALEEDDFVENVIASPLIKGLTLGELGYGPASMEKKTCQEPSYDGYNFVAGNVEYKTLPKHSKVYEPPDILDYGSFELQGEQPFICNPLPSHNPHNVI